MRERGRPPFHPTDRMVSLTFRLDRETATAIKSFGGNLSERIRTYVEWGLEKDGESNSPTKYSKAPNARPRLRNVRGRS